jgi:hypothetical protein
MDENLIKDTFPMFIKHPAHGLGVLKVKKYKNKCIAQYRHENGTVSLSTIGNTWFDVYREMLSIDFKKYSYD